MMPLPWWTRPATTLANMRPDVLPNMKQPPLTDRQIVADLYKYKLQGVSIAAMAREAGLCEWTVRGIMRMQRHPSATAAAKLSWLLRALNANQVKFIRAPSCEGSGRLIHVLVRPESDERALVAKPTLGICACGRYTSCPCGLATDTSRFATLSSRPGKGSENADSDVAVQQNVVRARVGHRKTRSKVPKMPF
jgi:hypothetical protein